MVGDDSRHRRDAVGVDLLRLLDPAENPVDLGLQMRGFPRREPAARQPGDTFHHGGVDSHSLRPFSPDERAYQAWPQISIAQQRHCLHQRAPPPLSAFPLDIAPAPPSFARKSRNRAPLLPRTLLLILARLERGRAPWMD